LLATAAAAIVAEAIAAWACGGATALWLLALCVCCVLQTARAAHRCLFFNCSLMWRHRDGMGDRNQWQTAVAGVTCYCRGRRGVNNVATWRDANDKRGGEMIAANDV